ncbi:L-lactate permease [compost metagenome]
MNFSGQTITLGRWLATTGHAFAFLSPAIGWIGVAITCGDETFLMEAGDVCVHPSNVPHGGRTTTGFRGIDIFVPPREDYLQLMAKHGLPIEGPK